VDPSSAANRWVDVSGICHPLGKIKIEMRDKRFSGLAKTAGYACSNRGCLPFRLSRSSRKRAWFPSSRPACFSSLSYIVCYRARPQFHSSVVAVGGVTTTFMDHFALMADEF
jgi:hypothetical protein